MTITGATGAQTLSSGARFTPTSKDGDGAVHSAEGVFVGTVYADVRHPYDMVTDRTEVITTFVALDPETYEELGRFDSQSEAIAALVDEDQKHSFAPEDDTTDPRCGDCGEYRDNRFHVGDVDYRYYEAHVEN